MGTKLCFLIASFIVLSGFSDVLIHRNDDANLNLETYEVSKVEIDTLSDVKASNTTSEKKKIWIDADLAVGMKRYHRDGFSDVDDGYAILQLLKSDEVEIKGISTVYGNTKVENAYSISKYMCQHFASYRIPVYMGAGNSMLLRDVRTNEGVEKLAESLRKEPMTILAIGPATNIGILLALYPELKSQVQEVVLVAGRRTPTDHFAIGNQGARAKDLNFDLDNVAFEILLQSGVDVVLCPFEISNKVWVGKKDLDILATGDEGAKWLSGHSEPWLQQWINQGAEGFNPFDVLASHYLLAPEDLIYEDLNARLEVHIDDTAGDENKTVFKNYLLCDEGQGYPVRYCYDVSPEYHKNLINSLK